MILSKRSSRAQPKQTANSRSSINTLQLFPQFLTPLDQEKQQLILQTQKPFPFPNKDQNLLRKMINQKHNILLSEDSQANHLENNKEKKKRIEWKS